MKAELKRLLAQPLIAPGISSRYITSGTNPVVDGLIAGECEDGPFLLPLSLNFKVAPQSQSRFDRFKES
jgi:hypothetical protein